MKVTQNVVKDLLPLYYGADCSADTKELVEEFFKSNPDFANEMKKGPATLAASIPQTLTPTDEMRTLQRARRVIKARSTLLGFAIFFSLAPFSFSVTDGQFRWLLGNSPVAMLAYGSAGLLYWIGYFVLRRMSRGL